MDTSKVFEFSETFILSPKHLVNVKHLFKLNNGKTKKS